MVYQELVVRAISRLSPPGPSVGPSFKHNQKSLLVFGTALIWLLASFVVAIVFAVTFCNAAFHCLYSEAS